MARSHQDNYVRTTHLNFAFTIEGFSTAYCREERSNNMLFTHALLYATLDILLPALYSIYTPTRGVWVIHKRRYR